jgi:sulfide:quinone oxidoreductase
VAERIVILGGGFAGMRALARLRAELGPEAELVLVDRTDRTLMTPLLVDVAFGERSTDSLRFSFAEAARERGTFVRGVVESLDADARIVSLADGTRLAYDRLVIALGAGRALEELPGAAAHAHLLWDAQTATRIAATLAEARARRWAVIDAPTRFGTRQVGAPRLWSALESVATEAALRLDGVLRRQGVREASTIVRVTPSPMIAPSAGPKGRAVIVRQLAERGIDVHADAAVERIEADRVVLADGASIEADGFIVLPPYRGPRALAASPLVDEGGFVVVDPVTMAVPDHPEIVACGDCCALLMPKLGHLTAIQADVAIDTVIRGVTGLAQPARPYEPEVMYLMAVGADRAQLIFNTTLYGGSDDLVFESPLVEVMRFTMNAWYETTRGELPPDRAKDTTRVFLRRLQRLRGGR